jgi:hypothetical protein
MAEVIVQTIKVTVQFDVNKVGTPETPIFITLDPDKVPPPQLTTLNIGQGISLLVFEVVTLNQGGGPEAQFPTYPIEWFTTTLGDQFNTPIAQPQCFEVHWYNPRQCTIVDTNAALSENPHPFNVLVAYANNTYGTDPVIVNMPPDGGIQTARVQEVIEDSEVSISLRKAGSPRKGSNQGSKNHRRS